MKIQFMLILRKSGRRTERAKMIRSNLGDCQRRYLIWEPGIKAYIKDGIPKYQSYEARDLHWTPPDEERIARIETFLALLKHPNFQLGLLTGPSFDIWYRIFNHNIALIELHLGEPVRNDDEDKDIPYNGCHIETEDPKVIQRLETNFQHQWSSLPDQWKDKDYIRSHVTRLLVQHLGYSPPSR